MHPEEGDEERKTLTRADAWTENHTSEGGCVCSDHIDKLQFNPVRC